MLLDELFYIHFLSFHLETAYIPVLKKYLSALTWFELLLNQLHFEEGELQMSDAKREE